MAAKHSLTIGTVARLAEVGVETIRFYERSKLLTRPSRPEAGFRTYPADTVGRVRFIRRAKALGFSLAEIRDLLSLKTAPGTSCARVRDRAQRKLADVDQKLSELRQVREALAELVNVCAGDVPVAECSILQRLSIEPPTRTEKNHG